MLKVLAVLRTVFLVFIVGYTVYAMAGPWADVARTFDEQYARCAAGLAQLRNAAWLAILWILLETIIGWFLATRAHRRPKLPGADLPRGEPPFAPPPRR
jgi:ABC-type Fe3+ transport system permease subunit